MRIALVTGGFDPLHSGHIDYIQSARFLADALVVGVNSDEWLTRKKGKPFMPFSERAAVISALKWVSTAFAFDDSDGSAIDAIKKTRQFFPNDTIIFCNGGDRMASNIPEIDCGVENVEYIFGVGGVDKKNSSSLILKAWNEAV